MPNYKMNISGNLGLSEYSNIVDYMGVVDNNDNFTITIDKLPKQDISIITSILKDSNFSIKEEGINVDGKYYINANKLK